MTALLFPPGQCWRGLPFEAVRWGVAKQTMARRAIRKTDFGTVLLHWTLVALLTIATLTGLRIALDSPHDMTWLHGFDWILPQSIVWTAHIPVGTALIALAISYTIYLVKSGLARRVRPDLSRLKGLTGRAAARYGAINLLLYWVLFVSLMVQLVTGTMLYIGYGGWAAELHLIFTWVIIGYVPCHIAVHYAIDGKYQLLRVFNPGKLAPRAPAFDPFELIAELIETKEKRPGTPGQRPADPPPPHPGGEPRPQQRGQRPVGEQFRSDQMLRAHPLANAIAGGLGLLACIV